VKVLGVRTKLLVLGALVAVALAGAGAWTVLRHDDGDDAPVEEQVQRVADARPLLLPTKIPAGWTARATVGRSFFRVRYSAPDGQRWFEVAIAVPNGSLPDDDTTMKAMKFRADDEADLESTGDSLALRWSEPGSWTSHVAGQPTDAVPYEVRSEGLDEAELLDIAESLEDVA
jgi:hypothetical protein